MLILSFGKISFNFLTNEIVSWVEFSFIKGFISKLTSCKLLKSKCFCKKHAKFSILEIQNSEGVPHQK